jgi:C_GCAxxG_C_C family probable redox protein
MTNDKQKKMDTEIVDKAGKRARELLKSYHGCAQCTLVALQEVYGMEDEALAKASVLVSGGVGRIRSVCGVLTGACLALGMKYGRDTSYLKGTEEDAVAKEEEGLEIARKLCRWFEREFGAVTCAELRRAYMGTDLDSYNPWEKQLADDLNMPGRCQDIAEQTTRRAAAILADPSIGVLDKI